MQGPRRAMPALSIGACERVARNGPKGRGYRGSLAELLVLTMRLDCNGLDRTFFPTLLCWVLVLNLE
eukprot:9493326-Pyramimonas_sp.AAC.1